MNKLYRTLCALIVGAFVFTSCLSDGEDEVTGYSDTAIIQFTLGTLNRYTHTTSSSTGNDTIVKTSVYGSSYNMTIDHLQRRIYNIKELPVGTDVRHVICTINTKNGGALAIQSMTSDSLRWFSSTDSIDFSSPRVFRVIASDGMSYRDYTVELNVSPTSGVDFGWQLVRTDDAWTNWSGKRLVAEGDTVVLADADSIFGKATSEKFMFTTDGQLKHSTDGGLSWLDEQKDEVDSLLPQAAKVACVVWPYAPAGQADYVLMAGTPRQDSEKYMRVWRKISYYDGSGQWVYMPFDDINIYSLPRTEWLTMAYYDKSVLCVGSDLVMRQSRDEGITWRTTSTYALPSGLTGTSVTMAVDDSQRLWLLTDTGQLWQGSLK